MSEGKIFYYFIIVLAMIFFSIAFETDIPLYTAMGTLAIGICEVIFE